jgi:hypothetical protein
MQNGNAQIIVAIPVAVTVLDRIRKYGIGIITSTLSLSCTYMIMSVDDTYAYYMR